MKLKLSDSIRELRRAQGITQDTLANALGVTAQAVSRWEAGATYPDIELIPAIANLFGISIDKLFGYSGEREEKVTEILKKIDKLNDASWRDDTNLDECISLLHSAMEEFPGNERIMNRLALILKQAGWARHHEWLYYGDDGHLRSDFDHHRANPYWMEAIELFQRIADEAVNQELRCSAIGELVLMYHMMGETDKAKSLAASTPKIEMCREIMLATASDGAEQTRFYAEALIALLNVFKLQLVYAVFSDKSNFENDIPVKAIQGLIGIFDLLYSDGNMGPQHAGVSDLYLYLSRLQWEYGQKDAAFESLDQALEHARRFDALTEDCKYTAPLVRHAKLSMPEVKPGNLAKNLSEDWPMWQNPDYAQVEKEIKVDPRWNEWVRRTRE